MIKNFPKCNTETVADLINQLTVCKLAVPEFQRAYVWTQAKAAKLMDSLYSRFPIASALIWETEDDVSTSTGKETATRYIIDGQQRITTLQMIKNGGEGLPMFFNPRIALRKERGTNCSDSYFKPDWKQNRNKDGTEKPDLNGKRQKEVDKLNEDPDWYSVADLFDDEKFADICEDLERNSERSSIRTCLEKCRRILDYPVPVVTLADTSVGESIEIFTRINQLGTKLNPADIAAAEVAGKHKNFIRNNVRPFIASLRAKQFDRLQLAHLFMACGKIARRVERERKIPLQELDTETLKMAWDETEKAVNRLIAMLKRQFGIEDMRNVLFSGPLLVVPIVLLANGKATEDEIAGWMALAAVHRRYGSSSMGKIEQDLKVCDTAKPVSNLLGNIRGENRFSNKLVISETAFRGNGSDRNALFAAYIACWHNEAQDFLPEGRKLGTYKFDVHHIMPKAGFTSRRNADRVANFAFITAEANRNVIRDEPASVYLPQLLEARGEAFLMSHCIPLDESLWSVDRADDFFAERRKLLANSFNAFIKAKLPGHKGTV